MPPDNAALLAFLTVAVAVAALAAAWWLARCVRGAGRDLERTRARLEGVEASVRKRLVAVRADLGSAEGAAARVRSQGRRLDRDLAAVAPELEAARESFQRVRQDGITPAARVIRWAVTLARVAVLWRSPAR